MNHDPRFKAIRSQVIEWLLANAPKRRASERTDRKTAPVVTGRLAQA